jgi:coenzyme F420-reducing hydrogenase delta subunit
VKLETKEESRKKLKDVIKGAKAEAPEDFTIEFHCQYQESESPLEDKKRGRYSIGKPCMARIDVYQLIHPFEEGSKGVEINKCEHHEECRFKGCDEWIHKHIESARKILGEIGIDADRLKLITEKEK